MTSAEKINISIEPQQLELIKKYLFKMKEIYEEGAILASRMHPGDGLASERLIRAKGINDLLCVLEKR